MHLCWSHVEHETVELCGLRVFGSSWCPWQVAGNPDQVVRNDACDLALARWQAAGHADPVPFCEVPKQIDILLSHGQPCGVFDQMRELIVIGGGVRL